jgi:hypothetical protein
VVVVWCMVYVGVGVTLIIFDASKMGTALCWHSFVHCAHFKQNA